MVDIATVDFGALQAGLELEQGFAREVATIEQLERDIPNMIARLDGYIARGKELGVDTSKYQALRDAVAAGMGAAITQLIGALATPAGR